MIKRWLLSGLLAILGLVNVIRAGTSFTMGSQLAKLNSAMFPLLGAFYAVLGIILLGLLVMCWRRNWRCPAFFVILGYEISIWIARILTLRSTYARSLWARDAIFSLVFLGLVFWLTYKPISILKS